MAVGGWQGWVGGWVGGRFGCWSRLTPSPPTSLSLSRVVLPCVSLPCVVLPWCTVLCCRYAQALMDREVAVLELAEQMAQREDELAASELASVEEGLAGAWWCVWRWWWEGGAHGELAASELACVEEGLAGAHTWCYCEGGHGTHRDATVLPPPPQPSPDPHTKVHLQMSMISPPTPTLFPPQTHSECIL